METLQNALQTLFFESVRCADGITNGFIFVVLIHSMMANVFVIFIKNIVHLIFSHLVLRTDILINLGRAC